MTGISTLELLNPMLRQALHRRRLRRRSRLCLAGWLFFGAIHIGVWWLTYDSSGLHLPDGLLGVAVWPLLLASTACFVGFLSYRIRREVNTMEMSASSNESAAADESTDRGQRPGSMSSSIAPVGA